MLKKLSKENLGYMLDNRIPGERLVLSEYIIENMDLSGWKLQNIDFSRGNLYNVDFTNANMSNIKAENTSFAGSILRGALFTNAILVSSDFRNCDLTGADFSGANLFAAALYHADLTDIRADERTQFLRPFCPETGAFIGWKVCFNRRIVQLLIPRDAARVSGTTTEVRCNKAKVLSIRSEDFQETFTEAFSYVDSNFIYRTGQMVYAENFEPQRFVESAGGIHLWLNRQEAIDYLGM